MAASSLRTARPMPAIVTAQKTYSQKNVDNAVGKLKQIRSRIKRVKNQLKLDPNTILENIYNGLDTRAGEERYGGDVYQNPNGILTPVDRGRTQQPDFGGRPNQLNRGQSSATDSASADVQGAEDAVGTQIASGDLIKYSQQRTSDIPDDVFILLPISELKKYSEFQFAKNGDVQAAANLAAKVVSDSYAKRIGDVVNANDAAQF